MRTRTGLAVAGFVVAGLGLGLAAQQKAAPAAKPTVSVFKSPTCGCCSMWVEHLKSQGFEVQAQNVSDAQLNAVAAQGGVTDDLRSCHTAKVGGYTVEGHVPAADIHRMLKEKPAIAGIAVPGMPMGSPGMEQGGRKDPFDTVAFTKDGKKTVFEKHR